jgi:conjugal transfer pilus assembly protein TraB
MNTLWGRAKDYWSKMDPDKQRKAVIAVLVIVMIVLGLWGYKITRGGDVPMKKKGEDAFAKISLDSKMTEKTLFAKATEQIGKQNDEIATIRAELNKLAKAQEQQAKTISANTDGNQTAPGIDPAGESNGDGNAITMPFPPPPKPQEQVKGRYKQPPRFSSTMPGDQASAVVMPQVMQKKIVGGINIVSVQVSKEKAEDNSKKKSSVYLPPSFMRATLLTGIDAPTTTAGESNPVPVLLRVRDIAVLPNSIKANLKGCFVIGEGRGNLSDERVHVRLTTLSCIADDGSAVIDQPITGFLQDEDGKVGLKGNVVAKMGAALARSLIAGFFTGVGDAMRESSTTVSEGAYGATKIWSDTDTDNLIRAGVGEGVATMADDLRKFYLELASQTMPVVEVGSAKPVELIVSKGVNLDIRVLDSRVGEI